MVESTPQMSTHLTLVTGIEDSRVALSPDRVDAFLNGDNIDDSEVYDLIKKRTRTYKKRTVKIPKKKESLAVSILIGILAEGLDDNKERKIKPFYW